jgi:aryl-alcohol dehydrogenase-like predicted oxidoreductase
VRTLGAGGLRVSPIGLGLAALGRPGYLNLGHERDLGEDRSVAALRARTHEVLDAAYAGGVRYLDAARSYGRAEDFLGSWLASRRPPDVTVGSKWGYVYTADWQVDADPPEVKDLSLANLRRQIGESRALLGTALDLYQIHSATVESGVFDDHEILEELAALRAGGLRIGLSVSGPGQSEAIERALELGGFDTVQATWNLHEQSAGAALAQAHAAGLGVIVKEALANGRLAARAADERLARAARAAGATPDALAIAAALAQPWADVVLSGAATVEALGSNLRARELEVDPAALADLREPSEEYWKRRSALTWT